MLASTAFEMQLAKRNWPTLLRQLHEFKVVEYEGRRLVTMVGEEDLAPEEKLRRIQAVVSSSLYPAAILRSLDLNFNNPWTDDPAERARQLAFLPLWEPYYQQQSITDGN